MRDGEKNFDVLSNEKGVEYTKVTFRPDLNQFKMETLDDDIVGMMARRAFDLAGTCKGVGVYLNKKRVEVRVIHLRFTILISSFRGRFFCLVLYEQITSECE